MTEVWLYNHQYRIFNAFSVIVKVTNIRSRIVPHVTLTELPAALLLHRLQWRHLQQKGNQFAALVQHIAAHVSSSYMVSRLNPIAGSHSANRRVSPVLIQAARKKMFCIRNCARSRLWPLRSCKPSKWQWSTRSDGRYPLIRRSVSHKSNRRLLCYWGMSVLLLLCY